MFGLFEKRSPHNDTPNSPKPPFRFGVATADHQVEAYVPEWADIRDVFEGNQTMQPRLRATDFWNRYGGDADLAAGLGCTAFRLSLAWARLQNADGTWNDAGFEHYRLVLEKLRANNLEPFVTLHHNTWPLAVENKGGMISPDFPALFEAYACEVARRLGDLITYYVTINEPNQLVYGYIKPWWMRAYPMPPGLPPLADTATQIGSVEKLIRSLFEANARAYAGIHKTHSDAGYGAPQVGANPLLFGFPTWIQRLLDLNATRLRRTDDLTKQGRRLTERRVLEFGKADIVLAQLTITQDRTEDALFSEAYYVGNSALFSIKAPPVEAAFSTWTGTIAVQSGTSSVAEAKAHFAGAKFNEVSTLDDAVAQVRAGIADAVFDDKVVLDQYATGGAMVTIVANSQSPYCAAVAPGNRGLLAAVDVAIKAFNVSRNVTDSERAARRGNASCETQNAPPIPKARVATTYGSNSIAELKKRGVLRVAIRPGVPGFCESSGNGGYTGIEPDLAKRIAAEIQSLGGPAQLDFVPIADDKRMESVRSPSLRWLDPILRIIAVFSTIVSTNWWYLGMSGQLAPFLCEKEWTDKCDYIGLDYYWGIRYLGFSNIQRLLAASHQKYSSAPVWPNILLQMLHEHARMFPKKRLFVIENGSVAVADGISRSDYIARHVAEVAKARSEGVPVDGYLCWSITSNREWGLYFNADSDFGLYFIDLDKDASLTRVSTSSADHYREIIAANQSI
jgi:beta-glucosidase/6-phospho-beta-glucosidase/beta-galactosidase/ABC-type amino acid transport substrate-binding protein